MRQDKARIATTLINFSGGVDSTYYLWRWLKENPKQRLLVHHCLLFEKRKDLEKKATDNILNWLRSNGLNNFDYVETRFEKLGIVGRVYDIEVIYFLAGMVAKGKRIETVIMSRCNEELNGNKGLKEYVRKHNEINGYICGSNRVSVAMQLARTVSRKNLKFISPYQNKNKSDMISEMPKELFEMTWYCRKPKEGKPCERCFNCRRVAMHLKKRTIKR